MPSHFAHRRSEYADMNVDAICRYWTDAAYRKRIDAETAHQRRLTHSRLDATMIASGNRWPAHWTEDEKADAERRGI